MNKKQTIALWVLVVWCAIMSNFYGISESQFTPINILIAKFIVGFFSYVLPLGIIIGYLVYTLRDKK